MPARNRHPLSKVRIFLCGLFCGRFSSKVKRGLCRLHLMISYPSKGAGGGGGGPARDPPPPRAHKKFARSQIGGETFFFSPRRVMHVLIPMKRGGSVHFPEEGRSRFLFSPRNLGSNLIFLNFFLHSQDSEMPRVAFKVASLG